MSETLKIQTEQAESHAVCRQIIKQWFEKEYPKGLATIDSKLAIMNFITKQLSMWIQVLDTIQQIGLYQTNLYHRIESRVENIKFMLEEKYNDDQTFFDEEVDSYFQTGTEQTADLIRDYVDSFLDLFPTGTDIREDADIIDPLEINITL